MKFLVLQKANAQDKVLEVLKGECLDVEQDNASNSMLIQLL